VARAFRRDDQHASYGGDNADDEKRFRLKLLSTQDAPHRVDDLGQHQRQQHAVQQMHDGARVITRYDVCSHLDDRGNQ
jgi:hypothetical protein